MTGTQDRTVRAPGFRLNINEDMIARLVHTFYARIRKDPALGPIFNAKVEDWDVHLAKLCDFWSSVILMTGRYKGKPVPAHVALPDIRPTHFARWLHLFRQTARETCEAEAAELFIAKAEKIAESLQLAISFHKGEMTITPPVQTRPQ